MGELWIIVLLVLAGIAISGMIGTITRIIPNAKYPYLISDNEPIGWYQKDSLEII